MWTNYREPPNIVNAVDVNNIYYNQLEILGKLVELKVFKRPASFKEVSANFSILYKDVEEIYKQLETNFDAINENECESVFYYAPMKRSSLEPNRKEWERWINILNDMYGIVNGQKGKWQYLRFADGYPTINGERILVRGDVISGV